MQNKISEARQQAFKHYELEAEEWQRNRPKHYSLDTSMPQAVGDYCTSAVGDHHQKVTQEPLPATPGNAYSSSVVTMVISSLLPRRFHRTPFTQSN